MAGFIYSRVPLFFFFLLMHEGGHAQVSYGDKGNGLHRSTGSNYMLRRTEKHAPTKAVKKKRKTGSERGCKQRRIATFTNKFAEYFHYTTVWRIYCQILSFVLFTLIYFRLLVTYLLRLHATSEPNECRTKSLFLLSIR